MCIELRGLLPACLALLAVVFLYACGQHAAPEDDPAPTAHTVAVQEVNPSASSPYTDPAGEDRAASAPEVQQKAVHFDEVLLAGVQRGMTLEAVEAIAGVAGVAVGGDGAGIEVLRYTDAAGRNFTARFDQGALRTRSGLRSPPAPDAPAVARESRSIPPEAAGERAVAEIAPGVFIPLERAVAASSGQPLGVEGIAVPSPDTGAPPAPAAASPVASRNAERGPAVVVAGGTRSAHEVTVEPGSAEGGSYNPRAKLPAFTRSLRDGSFEIRFVNPGAAPVSAGLRQDKLGLDITVPPGGQASLKVDRGVYQLFFVRESEPYTLYEAEPLSIDGFQATDVEVALDPEDVAVRLIDYSKPGS